MSSPHSAPRYWCLVPAAGAGVRMGAGLPKQYLPLAGRAVILHTLERLCGHPRIAGVLVGLSPGDVHWPALRADLPKLLGIYEGGESRAATVQNGLQALNRHARNDDWVLVHDAVRPCIRHEDIDRLMDDVGDHADGGLLGLPVADTLKRVQAREVVQTVDREHLWRALTPQLFRIGTLTEALSAALADGVAVTDEAAAIERAGGRPRMVPGRADNIKITHPDDLALAELFLERQAGHV